MRKTKIPKQAVDWAELEREFAAGAGMPALAKRHGVSRAMIRRRVGAAAPPPPPSPAAGGGTAPRLKLLLSRQIASLEAKPPDDPLQALHRLACIAQKTIDIERKETAGHDADTSRNTAIDDTSREALARRIEALAGQWEAAADPGRP